MTELDFDELDKAVNDLMKEVDEPSKEPAPAAVATADASEQTAPSGETIPVKTDEKPSAEKEDKADDTSPSLAVKRRGKFMDVMAPAGPRPVVAAPTSPAPVPAPEPVKHEGVTISEPNEDQSEQQDNTTEPIDVQNTTVPTNSPEPAEVEDDEPATQQDDQPETNNSEEPEPAAEPHEDTTADEPAEYAANPAPASDWPDPIDVSEEQAEKDVAEHDNSEDKAFSMPDPIDVAEKEETVKPEESLATVVTPDENTAASSEEPASQADEPSLASPFIPDAKVEKRPLGGRESTAVPTGASTLPRELGNDLMNLETDANNVAAAPATAKTDTSKEGAIYDTADYHKPLAAPAKQKSGWMAVIWILIVLIIGAMAGAAYFYFTTQH